MIIRETEAKSILLKHKKIDSWFISRYGLNLYRGCAHNCVYCDGRSERYQVNKAFGENVAVKINAVEVLTRELDPLDKFFKKMGLKEIPSQPRFSINRSTLPPTTQVVILSYPHQ